MLHSVKGVGGWGEELVKTGTNNDPAAADPWTFVDNNGGSVACFVPECFFMLLSECYLTIGIGATCFIIFDAKCLNEYCHGWTYSCSVKKMSECRRLFSSCSSAA